MKDEQQKQVQEGGHATFSVKMPQAMYDLVNILCEGLQHGTNGNDLFRMFIQTFIESAKHDGPISPDMQHFLNLLKIEPGWHKAFNFADVTAQTEVAQVILILQQKGKHGFGLTMIDKYKDAGKKKPYLIFSLTDETYSLLCNGQIPEMVDKQWYRFFVSVFNQSYWILGSVLGSLLKEFLTFDTTGIDFSMTALFVTVFVEQWLSTKNHWPAVIGLGAAAVCLVIFGPERFLLPAMIVIAFSLLLLRKTSKREGEDNV